MRVRLGVLCCTLLLAAALGPGPALGQSRPLDYRLTAAAQGAPAGTPFWQYAHTRGRYRPGSTLNGVMGAALRLPFRGGDGLDWSVGAEAVGRLSDATNTGHLLQLYGRLQYRGLRLSVGRFSDRMGLNPPTLSLGSMTVSRNAPPVPRVMVSAPSFLDVPGTGGHLQVRGRWSDGRLGADRAVDAPYLHQKAFYVRGVAGPVSVVAGVEHNAIWGGEGQSHTLTDYLRLVGGSQAGTESDANRVGNSVAAYDLALRYAPGDWQIQGYRQFYLEDTVSMRLRSPWDGLWGLSLRQTDGRSGLDRVVYEFVNTIQQDALAGAPPGRASYYNHFIYQSGWTYEDAVLGSPLMVFAPGRNEVVNNMVVAHHLGLGGAPTARFDYAVRLTYSRNYGVCEDQIITGTCRVTSTKPPPPDQEVRARETLREDQYAVGLKISYLLSPDYGLHFVGSTAADVGALYDDRWGLRLGLLWTGSVPTL
jgi:hypothetical protein